MISHSIVCDPSETYQHLVGDQYVLFQKSSPNVWELWLYDYLCPTNRTMLLRSDTPITKVQKALIETDNGIPMNQSFYFANNHTLHIFSYDKSKPNRLSLKFYDFRKNSSKPVRKEDYSFDANQNSNNMVINNKMFYQNIILDIETFEINYLIPCKNDTLNYTPDKRLYYVNKNDAIKSYFTIEKNIFVIEGTLSYVEMKNDTYIFRDNVTCKYTFVRKELETRKSTDINFVNGKICIKFSPKIFDMYEVHIDKDMTKLDSLEGLYEMLQDALNKTNPMITYEITSSEDCYVFELRDNHKYHRMVEQYTMTRVPNEVTIDQKLDYILGKIENI